jgi:hypothetical protein
MAFITFIAGIFLGTVFGFVVMALLTLSSRASDPERHQRMGVILSKSTLSPASLSFCWRAGHRTAEFVLSQGLEKEGDPRMGTRVWQ